MYKDAQSRIFNPHTHVGIHIWVSKSKQNVQTNFQLKQMKLTIIIPLFSKIQGVTCFLKSKG